MKITSSFFICAILTFLSFTLNAQVLQVDYESPEEVGRITSNRISEASGMAFSYKTDNAFWLHNDSGDEPNLYLVNKAGKLLTLGNITGASSRDWEDMASFVINGKSYLIIGDFGDNPRNKTNYTLYIIEEPSYNPSGNNASNYPIVRTINYTYDNGSQNCESIGVDTDTNKIILFSKSHNNEVRYVYEMPLSVEAGTETTTAVRIASLKSDDTTAMDISNDGHRAVVLTYKDFAYEFIREDNETWQQAFNKSSNRITMPIGRAGEEAIAYDTNGIDLYTVREGTGSEVFYLKGIEVDPNSPNQSEFISQNDVPKLLEKGEKTTVSVTMKNTGSTTWTKADLFKLGSLDDNDDLGVTRVELEENESIATGQEKTFTFDVTAPNSAGVYNFRWRMVKEDERAFGALSPREKIVVLGSNIYLDDCDAKENWNPANLQLNSTDKVQGTAALEFSDSNTDEYSKVFTTPFNVQGNSNNIILQFWYYISDITKLDTNNQVEISSSGGPDNNEYNWSLSNLKNGWNFIQLPVASANKSGTPNLTAINWFRLYRFKNGNVITRIDGIQLLNETILSSNNIEKKTNFRLYPIPAKGEFTLNFNVNNPSQMQVQVINILGQKVSKEIKKQFVNTGNQNIKINTSNFKKGVYFLKIEINKTITTKQFVIK